MTKRFISCLLLLAALFSVVSCDKKNNEGEPEAAFDFLRSDLSPYLEIPQSAYEGFVFDRVDVAPIDLEVNNEIAKLLYKNKISTDDTKKTDAIISVGDVTSIYYMGYMLENGKKSYFDGGCNLYGTPSSLGIGSGQFITGFEYNMIGKNPIDYVAITQANEIGESTLFLVLSYTYKSGGSSSSKRAVINLMDTDIDERYGEGFKAFITADGVTVGTAIASDFTTDAGVYSGITVTNAFDANDLTLPVMTVESFFPVNYNDASLQGKRVYFDVFVENMIEYSVPELNDAFVTDCVKMNAESLADYEGESLLEKYYAYVREEVEKSRENTLAPLIKEDMLEHIYDNAVFKALPESEVNRIYNDYVAQLQNAYTQYSSYYTFDEFARAYLGLGASADWNAQLKSYAEESLKQQLSIFCAFRDRGFIPNDEEYAALYSQFIDEQFEYYIGTTMTPGTKEYDDAKIKYQGEIEAYYGESTLRLSICYEYAIEKLYDLMYK